MWHCVELVVGGCIQMGPSGWGSVYPLDPAIFQIKLVHDFSLRTGPLSFVETKNNTKKIHHKTLGKTLQR